MRHGATLLLAAGLAGLAMPARGAEPARFAIMGLRLYMSAQDVLTGLYAQGVPEDAVTEHVHPCPLHASAACTDTVTARLADGPMVIRFTDAPPGFNDGREAVVSISYTLQRQPGTADAVRSAAEERFGRLSDGQDNVWCAHQTAQACPSDQPRMSFQRTPDGRATLSLADSGLAERLGFLTK